MTTSHVRGFLLPAGLIATVLFAGRCMGQIPGTEAVGGPNPNMPWLHPGLMISSTWMAAPRGGLSAGGITQSVISAMSDKLAIVVTTSFADVRALGVRDPQMQDLPTTYVVDVEKNDIWIDPAKLAAMKTDNDDHTLVSNVAWKAGDKTVDAIRITHLKEDHYLDRVFDRKSGLCLHLAESTGAPPLEGQGTGLVSRFEFISMRDVHTPWAKEAMPAWTSQFKALHYRGESRFNNAAFGGQPPTPLTLDVTRQDIGKDWVTLSGETHVFYGGQLQEGKKTVFTCGPDQYASYFAGPAALAKLKTGQVLDTDPLTHVQTTVSQADEHSVTIHSRSTGTEVQRTYDRQSGKMTGFSMMNMLSTMQTTIRLQREE